MPDFSNGPIPGGAEKPDKATRYTVAAMGFSILGGLLKGMADIQAGDFNAQIAKRNAVLADMAAGDALLRGNEKAGNVLMRGSALEAKQKAAFASSGVSTASGSVSDVTEGTDLMAELDAKILTNNARREAWGYKNQAENFRQKADLDQTNGRMGAISDGLAGITGAATYGTKNWLEIA